MFKFIEKMNFDEKRERKREKVKKVNDIFSQIVKEATSAYIEFTT